MKTLPEKYADDLIAQGIIKKDAYKKMVEKINKYFDEEFKASEQHKPTLKDTRDEKYAGNRSLTHKWKNMDYSQNGKEPKDTGVDIDRLKNIAKASVEYPPDV